MPDVLNLYRNKDASIFVALLSIIASVLGFGAAFVGSLNIQYSFMKIMVRYKYFQIFTVNATLMLVNFFVANLGDLQILFYGLSTWSLVWLYLHTFALIDKVYEPEELIVEVIAPMILEYANSPLGNVDIYGYFSKNSSLCIGFNPTFPFINSNPEFENFGKAIFRLAKAHSLKLRYLLAHLFTFGTDRKLDTNEINKFFKKEFTDPADLKKCVDAEHYYMFLFEYAVYQISALARNSEEYDVLYSQLLIIVISTLLSEGDNPKFKYGKLSDGNIVKMFIDLRDKHTVLAILGHTVSLNLSNPAKYHENKNEQILNVAVEVIYDFVEKNSPAILRNEAPIKHEALNLIGLADLSNELIDVLIKNINSAICEHFINLYLELVIYLHKKMEAIKFVPSKVHIRYIDNIFNKHWITLKRFLTQKIKEPKFMTVREDWYYAKFKKVISELEIANQWGLPEAKKNLMEFKEENGTALR
ncbi:MAG: hypothetical protein WCT53_01430 [Candidatus Gracilibacteria bacterium]